jgi:sec-independent protein translocase protein TatA
MAVIGVIAVLLFGDRLPEVMRSLGRGMIEFKKGMRGIESAIETASDSSARRPVSTYSDIDDREEITAPRFQPPPAEPRLEAANSDAPAQQNNAPLASQPEQAPPV